MAVLHALLRHEAAARAKPELQPIVARHDDVLLDRKMLPLAFHLLGAESMEQALFDGYIRQIRQLHPDAPLPAVHESDGVLADAERMRTRDGDDRFFTGLNGDADAGSSDAWSTLIGSGTWSIEKYEAARAAAPGSKSRQRLVTARRVSTSDVQIRTLLVALLAAPEQRLSPRQAAQALGVSPLVLRGAVLYVQQLLNVEGYPVVRLDADGSTVLLDAPLLKEQFGVLG